jgi:hypothetical protein
VNEDEMLRTQVDRMRQALGRAAEAMESVKVFVTTRERIREPEGVQWYEAEIAAAREALK